MDLNELAAAWFAAKAAENKAKDERLAIEAKLFALNSKESGSVTEKTPQWKVSVTNSLSLSADWEQLDDLVVTHQVPSHLLPIKTKREIDAKGLQWLKDNRPDLHAIIIKTITTKPAKPSVKCEPLEV